jgi:hypothetical protein
MRWKVRGFYGCSMRQWRICKLQLVLIWSEHEYVALLSSSIIALKIVIALFVETALNLRPVDFQSALQSLYFK